MNSTIIKLTFIQGLKDIVLKEISKYPQIHVIESGNAEVYIDFIHDFKILRSLKSIINIFAIKRGPDLNPSFIYKHKSLLGELIELSLKTSGDKFKTFKLSCAGPDSAEVIEIQNYITNTYKLTQDEEADMEIYIGKLNNIWEVGVRLTSRPLSLRDYKIENIKGGINPTIAYAINTFCNLESAKSYINIFSGSATLLIEAGLVNPKLKLFGFDINGRSTALAVKNIKKAGLIKNITLKNADIFDKPEVGTYDVITSDLPFGMQIGKDEDLEKLYKNFVKYCENILNKNGTLVAYTTEHELLAETLNKSKFKIIKELDLKILTSVNSYIYPKIFVCKLK